MWIRSIAATMVLATAIAAAQEPAPTPNPAKDYYASCIGNAAVMGVTYAAQASEQPGFTREHEAIFEQALACIEAKFRPALADAEGNAALTEALKNYHVAVRVWLSEIGRLERSQVAYRSKAAEARKQFSPAQQRLLMELQLAGKI